ncbi:hypothetical protein Q3F21_21430 [Brevibacillus borstelensis]
MGLLLKERDYAQSPFIVIWEVTRACALHCLHCRAEAQYASDPAQLTFEEGKRLVYPSGFLPVKAGNVREGSLQQIYREAPVMKQLRDKSLLKGKCGRCPYKEICGGSRARAYGVTGDYLESDPCCVYEPEKSAVESGESYDAT